MKNSTSKENCDSRGWWILTQDTKKSGFRMFPGTGVSGLQIIAVLIMVACFEFRVRFYAMSSWRGSMTKSGELTASYSEKIQNILRASLSWKTINNNLRSRGCNWGWVHSWLEPRLADQVPSVEVSSSWWVSSVSSKIATKNWLFC